MIVSELKQHCPHQVTLGNTTLFPCSVINEELFKITLCKNVTWAFTTRGQLFISEAFSVAVENYSGFCYCFALDLISSLQSSVGSFWEFVLVVKRSSFQVLQSLFDVPFTQTPVLYGCCIQIGWMIHWLADLSCGTRWYYILGYKVQFHFPAGWLMFNSVHTCF